MGNTSTKQVQPPISLRGIEDKLTPQDRARINAFVSTGNVQGAQHFVNSIRHKYQRKNSNPTRYNGAHNIGDLEIGNFLDIPPTPISRRRSSGFLIGGSTYGDYVTPGLTGGVRRRRRRLSSKRRSSKRRRH